MKRFAFTMLELVFVIVVIGIIAALAMPNLSTSPLQQAIEQVASHIRYTQHLAMVDDKYNDKNATWYLARWQIRFYEKGIPDNYYYTVFSDKDHNTNVDYGAGKTEVAIDPLTNKKLHVFDDNKNMDLTGTYGIVNVATSCFTNDGSLVTANKGVIVFDEFGRPYNGISNALTQSDYLLTQSCTIEFQHKSEGNATITIQPETGYVSVVYK